MPLFAGLNAQVLGISVDHTPCLKAWADSLEGITYPLLSDFWPHGEVSRKFGVFRKEEGHSERAIFIIDKDGIIQYIDIHDIDHQPENHVLFDELKRIDPEVAVNADLSRPGEDDPIPQANIVLYCTRWCPGCRKAREFFEANGIEYTEVDVHANLEAAERVRGWANGNVTTPTFDINGTIVVNYNLQAVKKALNMP